MAAVDVVEDSADPSGMKPHAASSDDELMKSRKGGRQIGKSGMAGPYAVGEMSSGKYGTILSGSC